MSQLIDFPQRQHEEFTALVKQAVTAAALKKQRQLDDYLQDIYYRGDNPKAFSSTETLQALYQQYKTLIESTVKSVQEANSMTKKDKAYLCYRIYLHGMTVERKVMPECDAKIFLVRALKEFFYAKGKVLSINDEISLFNSIQQARQQALSLKFK